MPRERAQRRGLSGPMWIGGSALALIAVAAMLVTFGISRFDEVGSRVARVRQAATAETYLLEYIGYQNQVHDAFLRVQAADPASKRVEAMTAALVPSDQLPAALNGYIKNSLNLPGEAQARRDQARLTAAYSKLARAAGPIIATSDAPASIVQERLAAVNAAYAKAIAAQEKIVTLYTDARRTEMARAAAIVADSRRKVELASVAGALFVLLLAAFAARASYRRNARFSRLERERRQTAHQNEFEARLQRALSMASSEAAVYPVVARALRESLSDEAAQVLLAASVRAPYEEVAITDADGARCRADGPNECVAARLGQTFEIASSDALDACPYVRDRDEQPCSALCVPIIVADRALGVIHTTGPAGDHLPVEVVKQVKLVARRSGEKIGTLRAFARSQAQATTDPLTGLANRRTLEEVAAEQMASGEPYAVAFGDLDHFKQLNDAFGHEAGDRALRLFARVLQHATRPGDLAVRYGGEEFVLFLPVCDDALAATIAERVRDELRKELVSDSAPEFTASFGVAMSGHRDAFADVLRAADEALLAAKAAGRDCVRVASQHVGRVAREAGAA